MNEELLPENEPQTSAQKCDWEKHFCTVTPFSKLLALALFVVLPFIGFWVGKTYEQVIQINSNGPNDCGVNLLPVSVPSMCEFDDYCCTESLRIMRENEYPYYDLQKNECPEGYTPNQLLCATSLRWCEPIGTDVHQDKYKVGSFLDAKAIVREIIEDSGGATPDAQIVQYPEIIMDMTESSGDLPRTVRLQNTGCVSQDVQMGSEVHISGEITNIIPDVGVIITCERGAKVEVLKTSDTDELSDDDSTLTTSSVSEVSHTSLVNVIEGVGTVLDNNMEDPSIGAYLTVSPDGPEETNLYIIYDPFVDGQKIICLNNIDNDFLVGDVVHYRGQKVTELNGLEVSTSIISVCESKEYYVNVLKRS